MKRIGIVFGILAVVVVIIIALNMATSKKKEPATTEDQTSQTSQTSDNTNTSDGTSTSSSDTLDDSKLILIDKNGFTPKTLTVPVGSIVYWFNKGTDAQTVTSTSDVGPGSTSFGNKGSYFYKFTSPGTYNYRSVLNTNFTGTVKVTE